MVGIFWRLDYTSNVTYRWHFAPKRLVWVAVRRQNGGRAGRVSKRRRQQRWQNAVYTRIQPASATCRFFVASHSRIPTGCNGGGGLVHTHTRPADRPLFSLRILTISPSRLHLPPSSLLALALLQRCETVRMGYRRHGDWPRLANKNGACMRVYIAAVASGTRVGE